MELKIDKNLGFGIGIFRDCKIKNDNMIEKINKYVINEEKETVVIIWKDGNKTIAKISEDDVFDKEFGFLLAFYKYYFLKVCKLSKNEYKREMECIKWTKLKEYLLMQFNRQTFRDTAKSKKYLENLKITISKKIEEL